MVEDAGERTGQTRGHGHGHSICRQGPYQCLRSFAGWDWGCRGGEGESSLFVSLGLGSWNEDDERRKPRVN